MSIIRKIVLIAFVASLFHVPVSFATEGQRCSATDETKTKVLGIIHETAERYSIPEWFLLAIVHRESSFDPNCVNMNDGVGGTSNWNAKKPECAFTSDGYPHGLGLTQLTGWMYQGTPYPYCLAAPDNGNKQYYYSMRLQDYAGWISMTKVSWMNNPFSPRQNLRRFASGYAVPAYKLFRSLYPLEAKEDTWRRVAFHWNKGMYATYDPNNTDYLQRYDEYVARYQ